LRVVLRLREGALVLEGARLAVMCFGSSGMPCSSHPLWNIVAINDGGDAFPPLAFGSISLVANNHAAQTEHPLANRLQYSISYYRQLHPS
jgi:hypothetical protein